MRKLAATLCLTIAVFFGSAGMSFAKPWCLSNPTERFHDCVGRSFYPNGDKYVGVWRNGQRHGQGTYTNANGSNYVGEFKNGTYNGQGTYTFVDGSKHVGEFRDGKPHGQGTYTYADGRTEEGIWKNGKLQPKPPVVKPKPPVVKTEAIPKPKRKPKVTPQTEGIWKNGKKHGPWVSHHPDRTVRMNNTGTFLNGKKVTPAQYLGSEIRDQLQKCWLIPSSRSESRTEYPVIEVQIALKKNGELKREPIILNKIKTNRNKNIVLLEKSVLNALNDPKCVPFKLPVSLYNIWKKIIFIFDIKNF